MLNDWALSNCCSLSSSSVYTNAITKSKDVFKSLVLKSIRIDINDSLSVSNTAIEQSSLRFAGRINDCREEILFNDLSSLNASEDSNLLFLFVLLDFKHFPSKVNINTSLVALFKSNFVSIWELEYFLVWSPELDS